MKLNKLIVIFAVLALCLAGCKDRDVGTEIKPTETVLPTIEEETIFTEEATETNTESDDMVDHDNSSFAGGLLEESTESNGEDEGNQETTEEPDINADQDASKDDDVTTTEPSEETGLPAGTDETQQPETEETSEMPTDVGETEPEEKNPEETQPDSVIPENNYEGDLLEPPSEGSDGVL